MPDLTAALPDKAAKEKQEIMRRTTIIIMAAALALVSACKNKEPKNSCVWGNDIPDEQLLPVMEMSDALIDLLVKRDYAGVYEAGTNEMKAKQNRDQFAQTITMVFQSFGNIDYPRIEEAYILTSTSKDPVVWIPCNLGEPGVDDLFSLPSNGTFAVTIYRAHGALEEMRVVFLLENLNDRWFLRSLTLNPMTLKKKLPDYYLQKALVYREQNKLHLAVLYYKTAILLSDIGLNVAEFTVKVMSEQMSRIKIDYMPTGQPQLWATDTGNNYKVFNLDTAYENGNLLVQVSYQTETLKDREKLAREAQDLATFLDKKFPEYREGFDGFRITAAPEAKAELLQAFHTTILYTELDQKKQEAGTP